MGCLLLLELTNEKEIVQAVQTAWRDMKNRYSERNRAYEANEDLYFMRHWSKEGPEVPGEERVTLATHTNVIDLSQGILSAQDFRITAFPKQDIHPLQAAASDVERFCYGIIYVNEERQEDNLRQDVSHNQLLYGAAVVRSIWDMDLAGQEQADETGNPAGWEDLPLVVQSINPKYVYPMPGGKRGPWQYVIYACRRSVSEIESEWGPIMASPYTTMNLRSKQRKEIDYVDYWGWENTDQGSQVVNCVIAGDVLLKPPTVENGYKDLPYTIIPCKKTSSTKGDEQNLSMLYPIKDTVHNLEQTLTKQNRAIKMWAYAPPVYEGPPGNAPQIDTTLGEVITINPGSKFGFMGWQGNAPDISMQVNIFKQEVQEGSFPAVSYGQGPGSMSGYALTTLSEGGRIRLQMPKRAQELGWQIVFRKCLSLAQHFSPNTPLTVHGDYKGQPFACSLPGLATKDMRIVVSISTRMPQDKARDEAMGSQLKAQGVLSDRTLLEQYFQVDDPDKEIERKMYEKVLQHPFFQLLRMSQVAIQNGVPPQLVAQTLGPIMAQSMAQTGQPGGTMTAQGDVVNQKGPGMPEPGQPQGGPPPARPRVAPSTIPGAQMGQMTSQEMGMAPNVGNITEQNR